MDRISAARSTKARSPAVSLRMPGSLLAQAIARRFRALQLSGCFWMAAIVLSFSLLLGGGTRSGFLSDALLQLVSIPPFLLASSRLFDLTRCDLRQSRQAKFALMFCCAVLLVPLLQLVRLPPALWSELPHRGPIIAVLKAVGDGPNWLPVSVSPTATALSALSLLPPLAVFFGVLLLDYRERRLLSLVLVGLAVLSAFLGLLQISQGPASALRFYSVTNPSEAVGFFANRNHFAALLYVAVPFAGLWLAEIASSVRLWPVRRTFDTGAILIPTAGFLAIVVLLAAEAMARSRAGMILTMAALAGLYVLMVWNRKPIFNATPATLVAAAAGTAVILVVQFGLYRALDRFMADPLDDARLQIVRTTMRAALAYLPFGSGMGTFVPVYAMFEAPADLFSRYVNHAHNDFLELWLESGMVGLGLLAVFAVWYGFRSVKVWRRAGMDGADFDRSLMRVATLAVGFIALHSFVDYPLRTAAMMSVLAFACGVMIEPFDRAKQAGAGNDIVPDAAPLRRSAGKPSAPPEAAAASRLSGANKPAADIEAPCRPAARWGKDVEWPEAWRKHKDLPIPDEPTTRPDKK